ncbi:hypothetical protein [Aridibaculum aurantiacum]|uniref:hypothetical protein n=1 Tax=Aridibaculum aurantiacum TaxID=2810307 RepID=UPI001A96E2FD|nr:hypothetical protein [Aridibaculum aurantiacum]
MKKIVALCTVAVVLFSSCAKQIESIGAKATSNLNEFVKYTIASGQHNSDKNGYAQVHYDEQKFVVKFDSSAIYTTVSSLNQKDVNKLFGFSDNNGSHHQFSARFGWRWSNNALRLFAYVYNNGALSIHEMGTVAIGAEVNCSIRVTSKEYIFTMGDKVQTMPRNSTTPKGSGYKLYPYFGGDETAPHTISIWIKEIA